eukprot:COSAG01_NODE_22671_length_846_cov_0.771084_2_plen_22_part_01
MLTMVRWDSVDLHPNGTPKAIA